MGTLTISMNTANPYSHRRARPPLKRRQLRMPHTAATRMTNPKATSNCGVRRYRCTQSIPSARRHECRATPNAKIRHEASRNTRGASDERAGLLSGMDVTVNLLVAAKREHLSLEI